MIKGAHRAIC